MNSKFRVVSILFATIGVLLLSITAYSQNSASKDKRVNVSKAIDTTRIAEPLNGKVNTMYVESGPMLTKDGKRLYFSRHGDPKNIGGIKDQDIWFSEFDDETQSWLEATNIGAPLNNKGPNFICGVGWKGDSVLVGNVYAKNGKMSAGISISIKSGDVWSFPKAVYLPNDYNISDRVGYDLSSDRNTLIIAQEKEDSNGKLDLYAAFRDKKTKKEFAGTESINLGPIINSIGNESSPFLSYDGKTLFFSSDGHNGYGKEDIFMSKRLDNTWKNWSKPENLGPGINTPYDDSYFGFTPNSRYAYYSKGLASTNSDIYKIEMTYLFNDVEELLANLNEETSPLEIGAVHVIKNVFNDDKDVVNASAEKELEAIFNYLERYKTMTVLIRTHSNKHNSRNESFTLSNKRIETIKQYLISRGIEKSRLNYQGYGQDVLVNTKDPVLAKEIPGQVEFKFVNYGR